MIKQLFELYSEITNIYSFIYCIFVSVLSVYAIVTGTHDTHFNTLRLSTLYYMIFSMPRHLVEVIHYSIKMKSDFAGTNEEKNKFIRRMTSARNKGLEYLIHHIAAITIFYHTPSLQHNMKFCVVKYTEFHLFEVSSIFITLLSSPFLTKMFIGNNKTYELGYKLIFMMSFIGIRVLWLLPKFTLDLYYHRFGGDYVWKMHLLILAVFFWSLHIVWTYKLLSKFSRDICKNNSTLTTISGSSGKKDQ